MAVSRSLGVVRVLAAVTNINISRYKIRSGVVGRIVGGWNNGIVDVHRVGGSFKSVGFEI